MPFLKTLTPTKTNLLGNKDRKKLNLNPSSYKMISTKEKITIITENEKPILIQSDRLVIPTIRNVTNSNVVVLDDGALKPILGGANVMAPGIFKYKGSLDYRINDIVFIKIDEEIVAVGVAVMDYKDITSASKGIAVDIWQRKGDFIDNL